MDLCIFFSFFLFLDSWSKQTTFLIIVKFIREYDIWLFMYLQKDMIRSKCRTSESAN